MAYFNRDDRSGGKRFGKRFGGDRNFGGKQGGKPFMHKAVCAECGKECEVPFKPAPGRPIYCSECFEKRGNSGGRPERNFEHKFDRGNDFGGKKVFEKPHFEDRPKLSNEHYEILNSKLDKILLALAPKAEEKTPLAAKKTKETKKVKAPAKKKKK